MGGLLMLHTLDYLVIAGYLGFVLFIGWTCSKENKTSEDYFMAGRSFSWLPIALSVAATTISANSFIGGPGWAYTEGLYPYMINIAVPLSIFFVVFTTLPVCYHLKLTSIYEYVELRLGPITRNITVFGFFANAIIQIGSMVFVPSLMISFFTEWPLSTVVPVVVLTAIGYTLLGGIRAVIWTDVCQMAVLWGSLIMIVYIIVKGIPLSNSELLIKLSQSGKLNALDFSTDLTSSYSVIATLLGGFIMWVNYFGFNQVQIQRVLTAKSITDAKRSFFSSAVIMNTMYFLFMILGILLFVFFRGRTFTNSNEVMFHFVSTHLPKGFIGLVTAGVFASAMSSVDSLFNSMTTVFIKDVYEKHISPSNDPTSMRTTIGISSLFGIVVTLVALLGFSKSAESVLSVVGNYISYISGPMAAIYFLSFFVTLANDRGTAMGSVIAFVLVIILCSFYIKVGWIWKPAIGFSIAIPLSIFFSILFANRASDTHKKHFTLFAIMREQMTSSKREERGASLLPFTFETYAMLSLVFFALQYVFLWLISR